VFCGGADTIAGANANDESDSGEGLHCAGWVDSHQGAPVRKDHRHDFFRFRGFRAIHGGAQAADENAHDAERAESDDDSRV